MSVLIKGMEMPKDCKNCPFLCDYSCRVLLFEPDWGKSGRDERCPLTPVPPHGRLIDADALLAEYERDEKAADDHGHEFSFSFWSGNDDCTSWWHVQQKLMDAPTVIEAEGGE